MTEEFWASYKNNKDKQQTNMLWKNVTPILFPLKSYIDFRRNEKRAY
jgi:hypothetical protein